MNESTRKQTSNLVLFLLGAVVFAQACGGPRCPDDPGYRYDSKTRTCIDLGEELAEDYNNYRAEEAYKAFKADQAEMKYKEYLDEQFRKQKEELLEDQRQQYEDYLEDKREDYEDHLKARDDGDEAEQNSGNNWQPYVRTAANLRSGPGTNYLIVGTVKVGDRLDLPFCTQATDGYIWYQLVSEAWIRADLVGNPPTCESRTAAPSCIIKGNVGFITQEKIYHLPGCESYDKTTIDTRYGERWFCTEAEAQAAGWRKARNCP